MNLTISEAISRIDNIGAKVAEIAKDIMQEEISANVKEGSGNLANSITVTQVNDTTWAVGSELFYSKFVDQGRGVVLPDESPVLRWYSPRMSGNAVFAKRASATKGIHFIEKTKNKVESMTITM